MDKHYKFELLFVAVIFIAFFAYTQISSNPSDRPAYNDYEIARSRVKLTNIGMIATNTSAFEKYAFTVMLDQANQIRIKWNLDIPKPLKFNDVLISLKAGMYGFNGGICTRDKRFELGYTDGVMVNFFDFNYYPGSFRYKYNESARLAKIPSKINMAQAEEIARDYLKRLGLSIKELGLAEPPLEFQYKFEENDGIKYPLPCFHFAWHRTNDSELEPVQIDISGITKQVAEFCNYTELRPHHGMPTNLPPNYFEMLGVKPPSNEAQLLGHKPLDPITIGSSSTNGR